ncbi:DUF6261 family protein [Marinilabilia rubra]|nr:DUF6261 family protein [Marinilabilia rubra]
MIKSINYSILTVEQLYTLTQSLLNICNGMPEPHEVLTPFVAKAKKHFNAFSNAFEVNHKNPYTPLKAQKDSERDEAFVAFRNFVEACSHRRNPEVAQAAVKIMGIINRYGWTLWRSGYKTETAKIDNLVADLEANHIEELSVMGARDWLDELEAANADFKEVAMKSILQAEDDPTLTETRVPLESALRSLLSITELLNESEQTAEMKELIESLNEAITPAMATARAAQTRQQNQASNNINPN